MRTNNLVVGAFNTGAHTNFPAVSVLAEPQRDDPLSDGGAQGGEARESTTGCVFTNEYSRGGREQFERRQPVLVRSKDSRITTRRNRVKSRFAMETQYTKEDPEAGTILGTATAQTFLTSALGRFTSLK